MTTSMVGLKSGHIRKNLPSPPPSQKKVNPRAVAGNTEEEEVSVVKSDIACGVPI